MSRKTKASYLRVLEYLKELIRLFNAKYLMSDYERGLLEALKEAFPDAELSGCLFHFDQVCFSLKL